MAQYIFRKPCLQRFMLCFPKKVRRHNLTLVSRLKNLLRRHWSSGISKDGACQGEVIVHGSDYTRQALRFTIQARTASARQRGLGSPGSRFIQRALAWFRLSVSSLSKSRRPPVLSITSTIAGTEHRENTKSRGISLGHIQAVAA